MNLPYEQKNMRSGICFILMGADHPHTWLEPWKFSLFTINVDDWV